MARMRSGGRKKIDGSPIREESSAVVRETVKGRVGSCGDEIARRPATRVLANLAVVFQNIHAQQNFHWPRPVGRGLS